MATYYVRPDGNNSNTGLGSGTSTAWQTLTKALGATGIGSGDTLYIAPGTYTEAVTIGGTYTAPTYVYGDPLCQQFTGISTGSVRHSSASSTGNDRIVNGILLSGSGKSNLNFRNIHWLSCNAASQVNLLLGQNNTFTKCVFEQVFNQAVANVNISSPSTLAVNVVFDSCIFITGTGGNGSIVITGNNVADTSAVKNCLFIGSNTFHCVLLISTQCKVTNCSFHSFGIGVGVSTGSATFVSTVENCVFARCNNAVVSVTLGWVTATYNRLCLSNLANVPTSVTNITEGISGLDTGYSLLTGLQNLQFFSSYFGSPNTSAGIATGAPVTDMYGVTWTGTSPDTGSATYRNLSSVSTYLPSERNASTITIAPGSTSQSIEVYLGVTGLTASTSGLSARYNRTRTASVDIPLVARTIAQAWTSGGFAEVDATNMPGVYRLDLPDAALAAGADDVTIVMRGASGTNGAVMTVKLSSGGLTSAQTAAAVWDEARSSHVTAGTFGQYVNAELVTPVTSAALVRMGPYEVKADGLGASDPLDIQKGAQHGVDIQCVDAFGSGIDITSATVTAKVYNSGATLVDTYACTATYAADGRATFTIDTTVTDTPGTYTATITRTTGASDTQIFGPLRIYVRDI